VGRKYFWGLLAIVACSSKAPPTLGDIDTPPPLWDPSAGPVFATSGPANGAGGLTVPTAAPSDDPATCEQALLSKSYVGCDYFPTVVANNVWSIFDFAVVVANAGTTTAKVDVTGPMSTSITQMIEPDSLAKIYLPWVPELKGADFDTCTEAVPLGASVVAKAAAYHLVSSVPVTVYQFNALEFGPKGGPAGKSWAKCPGSQPCPLGGVAGCWSFSNDSSLLFPSTAMTGTYRVTGFTGESEIQAGQINPFMNTYLAITATQPGTHVTVHLSPTGSLLAGGGVPATPASPDGGTVNLTLDQGDVAELASGQGNTVDLSGSLVEADQPVQVIAGSPCALVPESIDACDHLEQSVFPAETLGTHYFVTVPSGPRGRPVGHVVRFYGNAAGTTNLTYSPPPMGCVKTWDLVTDPTQFEMLAQELSDCLAGATPVVALECPSTLVAGQVGECNGIVTSDFEVTGSSLTGSSEFAVGSFMLGGSLIDIDGEGDPSESLMASVEQYRTKYVFLAPDDYDVNFADIVAPSGANVFLDGKQLNSGRSMPIAGGYGALRVPLVGVNTAGHGVHVLVASAPVGLQVLGYGSYTSYQYPGGLNLTPIAPAPPR
jgi:IgGFc binding protein